MPAAEESRLRTSPSEREGRPEPDEYDLAAEAEELELRREVSLTKRRGNVALVERARGYHVEGPVDFLCECGSLDCLSRIPLTVEDYERLSRFGFVGARTCPPDTRLLVAA